MSTVPQLTNAEGQMFPEMSVISTEQWDNETGYVADRLAPVFPSQRPFRRVTEWPLEDMLVSLKNRLRARGDVGPKLGTTRPKYRDFYVEQGQVRWELPQEELDDAAADGFPGRPWEVRTRLATSGLKLSVEQGIKPYFTPDSTEWNALGATTVDAESNWELDPNPGIGKQIKALATAFALKYKRPANFFLIDKTTDTWFLDRLAEERKVQISVAGYRSIPDLLPSADGVVIADMTGIVPGAKVNSTPGSVFTPEWVWGDLPFFIIGYSPTLDGSAWNGVGDCHIFQPELLPPMNGAPLQVMRMTDPMFGMNKLHHGWIDFNRDIQHMESNGTPRPLVMAYRGIR